MAKTPQEAMTEEEYDRWDKGLRQRKPTTSTRPEAPSPEVKDRILSKDVPADKVTRISTPIAKIIKDKNGVHTGYRITIEMGEKKVSGWMVEGEYLALRREMGERFT